MDDKIPSSTSPSLSPIRSSRSSRSSSFRLRCPSLNSLRLRRIFDMFDKNGDDMITVQDISQALSLLGLDAEVAELDSLIRSYIKPGNEGLAFEDFVALHESLGDTYFGFLDNKEDAGEGEGEGVGEGEDDEEMLEAERRAQEESDLWEAFKVFDEDGDGYISAKELQVVLGKLGLIEGNEIDKVHKMILSVDRNHDGRVDFDEFKDMMRAGLVRNS